jgi:hypothetical protein
MNERERKPGQKSDAAFGKSSELVGVFKEARRNFTVLLFFSLKVH